MAKYDILRKIRTADSDLGGWKITFSAVAVEDIDLQPLVGREPLEIGGQRIEAIAKGWIRKEADLRESDVITPDSGTTRYEVGFIQHLWSDHMEFYSKKVD